MWLVPLTDRSRYTAPVQWPTGPTLRPVSRNVVWGVECRGDAEGVDRVGSGEGVSPSLVGVGCGEGAVPPPRKILAFSPSKWCILMHSGARFRPTRPITAIMMFMTLLLLCYSNILKLHMFKVSAKR